MGKKHKNDYFSAMRDLREEEKKIKKKLKQITIPCPHTNHKGKLSGEFIKGDLFQCKRCGQKFSFTQISSDTLSDAIRVCQNAINQIKAFSDNPQEEESLIRSLGELSYNLGEVGDLYNRVCSGPKEKKKNKHRNNDDNGFGGYGSIGFIGDKKKKKKNKFC